MENKFEVVGIRRPLQAQKAVHRGKEQRLPVFPAIVLGMIVLGCLSCGLIATRDPGYLDLQNYSAAPDGEFLRFQP